MIKSINNTFFLNTKNTSYVITINKYNIPITLYYGKVIKPCDSIVPIICRNELPSKDLNRYNESPENFYLELNPLEYSIRNYDGRTPSLKIENQSFDFKYLKHKITKEDYNIKSDLPSFTSSNNDKLIMTLIDKKLNIKIEIIYTVFESEDIITKQVIIKNSSANTYIIRNVASMQFDLLKDRDYEVISYKTNMIESKKALTEETTRYFSNCGTSCNNNSPFLILKEQKSNNSYGFAYMYSSNFYINTEINKFGIIHINMGINDFRTSLSNQEEFITPIAVLTYTADGKKGINNNFSRFTKNHIIDKTWSKRAKPLAFHSFNTLRYKYNENEAKKLVKETNKMGYELFVLDDGWFALRDDKTKSLGDWFVDTKKFNEGLEEFSTFVHNNGMLFGLYLAPEMVSKYSLYYKKNKNYLLLDQNIDRTEFPTSYILDLTKQHVQDDLIKRLVDLIKVVNVDYIYWDLQKELPQNKTNDFYHKYILGLYRVLKEIKEIFPKLLIETNYLRSDLGILNYISQLNISNNTDAYENLKTLESAASFFNLSNIVNTIGNKQDLTTLRNIDLENKFNLSCFGTLSYNLDIKALKKVDFTQIKKQIDLYKMRRNLFQFGNFYIIKSVYSSNTVVYQVSDNFYSNNYVLFFQKESKPTPYFDKLIIKEIDTDAKYLVTSREQKYRLKMIKPIIDEFNKIKINDEILLSDTLDNNFLIKNELEAYKINGDILLNCGIVLNNNYKGTGINESTRIMFDYSSRLYEIKKI